MEFSQEEFDDILNIFNEESEEIIQRLNNNILTLEKTPNNKDVLIELFRDAHSLKGAARMIGFDDIQSIAHKVEDILGLARDNKIIINSEVTDTLYKAIDFIHLNIILSVKEKKEVKLNDYGKFISSLNEIQSKPLHNTPEIKKSGAEKTAETHQQPSTTNEQTFLANIEKEVNTVNAKITEIIYLLNKINEEADLNCILALIYDIEKLKSIFEKSSNKELNQLLIDIAFKLDFVAKNTGILNRIETEELKEKFKQITAIIKGLFTIWGFEVLEYENLAQSKIENKASSVTKADKRIYPEFDAKELVEKLLDLAIKMDNLDCILEEIQKLISRYENTSIEIIFRKIFSILSLIKRQNTRPDSEILKILKQGILLIEKLINDAQEADKEDINLLLQSLDITEQMIGIKKEETLSELPVKPFNKPIKSDNSLTIQGQDVFQIFEATAIKTLRVDTQKLDKLVNQIGEVIISKIKTQKHVLELDEINNRLNDLHEYSQKINNYLHYYDKKMMLVEKDGDISLYTNFNKQVLSYLSESQTKLNSEIQEIYKLHKRMLEDDAKLTHVVNKLEQMVKDIRLLPLATVFHMIPRMVRDIAKEKDKEIDLSISGSETSADKKIIEEIKTPLIHIIRNAIDHGIELPNERIAKGKDPIGKIYLNARHKENKIIIEISDDGRGVNLEKIKQKAITEELLTFDEINSMTDEQIMNLIFWPGFTTGTTITELSGRGVGLDIVQTKISQLNGKVKVHSVLGQGTVVRIELPVTMATVKSFIINVNSQFFAVPIANIKSVIKVRTEDIYAKDGKANILYQQTSVPIFNMASALGFDATVTAKEKKTILLIESENNIVGFVIDELIGDQEILTKELAPPLFKIKNISGITTLVNGESCLIVNVSELLKSVMAGDYKYSSISKFIGMNANSMYNPQDYIILVVDDFMTTRIMLKNILNAKGYNVDVANNAISALTMIENQNYDIVISDIEMPDMSGYELASNIKKSHITSNTPVILISSLAGKENTEKVKNSGADLFINKNEFNQEYFLRSIEYLIKKRSKNAN